MVLVNLVLVGILTVTANQASAVSGTAANAQRYIADLPSDLPGLFDACEYRLPDQQEAFRYRLFAPRNMKPGERYPLLMWLHGFGESGTDNVASLRWLHLVLKDRAHVEAYRFFILVVQCPPTNSEWVRTRGAGSVADDGTDMLTVAADILQKTMQEQPVDADRVYLAGVCTGGTGCWELAMRHPELFAAVVPMSTGGGDVSRAARLAQIPIWAFHNRDDRKSPRAGTERMVAAIEAAGGNVYLTLPRSSEHECWTVAIRECDVMGWMLAQRRGAAVCWTPPGCRLWHWWHILTIPSIFLAIAWWGWRSERQRRLRR